MPDASIRVPAENSSSIRARFREAAEGRLALADPAVQLVTDFAFPQPVTVPEALAIDNGLREMIQAGVSERPVTAAAHVMVEHSDQASTAVRGLISRAQFEHRPEHSIGRGGRRDIGAQGDAVTARGASWRVHLAHPIRALGYPAIVLMVPGGSLIALTVWMLRHRTWFAARMRRGLAAILAFCIGLSFRR